MNIYRKLRKWMALLLVCYLITGYSTAFIFGKEIFPIAAWRMFMFIPQSEVQNFGLRLINIEGHILETPIYFEEANEWFVDINVRGVYAHTQTLGKAIADGDQDRILQAETHLETTHLSRVHSARYEIVARTYNLLDWHAQRTSIQETPLALFEYRRVVK